MLQPWLLSYYHGSLNIDLSCVLTSVLTERCSGVADIGWEEVMEHPEFGGHTQGSLRLGAAVSQPNQNAPSCCQVCLLPAPPPRCPPSEDGLQLPDPAAGERHTATRE